MQLAISCRICTPNPFLNLGSLRSSRWGLVLLRLRLWKTLRRFPFIVDGLYELVGLYWIDHGGLLRKGWCFNFCLFILFPFLLSVLSCDGLYLDHGLFIPLRLTCLLFVLHLVSRDFEGGHCGKPKNPGSFSGSFLFQEFVFATRFFRVFHAAHPNSVNLASLVLWRRMVSLFDLWFLTLWYFLMYLLWWISALRLNFRCGNMVASFATSGYFM